MKIKCPNMNHSKINVLVRFCSMCGETVNGRLTKQPCSPEKHARARKERSRYCADCGKPLS